MVKNLNAELKWTDPQAENAKMDWGLPDDAIKMTEQIADNVVEKLRIVLGIPAADNYQVGHDALKKFFFEKFRPPQDFKANVDDKPNLEMLNKKIFGYDLESKEKHRQKVSRESEIIREQMIGYTDAIIERQDRYDILKTMESFDIETKTRKVMKELVDHYEKQNDRMKESVEQQRCNNNSAMKKFAIQEQSIKKLTSLCGEIPILKARVAKERVDGDA
jgi:hypothetical protein